MTTHYKPLIPQLVEKWESILEDSKTHFSHKESGLACPYYRVVFPDEILQGRTKSTRKNDKAVQERQRTPQKDKLITPPSRPREPAGNFDKLQEVNKQNKRSIAGDIYSLLK